VGVWGCGGGGVGVGVGVGVRVCVYVCACVFVSASVCVSTARGTPEEPQDLEAPRINKYFPCCANLIILV